MRKVKKASFHCVSFFLIIAMLFATIGCNFGDTIIEEQKLSLSTAKDQVRYGYLYYDGLSLVSGDSSDVYIALQMQIENIIQQQNRTAIIKEIFFYSIPCELFETDEENFESFMGFRRADLMAMFGPCSTLIFGDTGPVVAPTLSAPIQKVAFTQTEPNEFDFANFIKKMALGCCIMVVGATISIATGGTFTCALLSIAREAAVEGIISGSISAFSVATSDINNGENIATAFLNGFSTGFLAGSVSGSICSIIWHPSCFEKDTLVATPSGSYPIQDTVVGDYVLSKNLNTGAIESKRVLNIFVNETDELVHITTSNGERINCTPSHPFFVSSVGWIPANELHNSDSLINFEGEIVTVCNVEQEILQEPILVYNIEVEQNHNYFVGETPVLVHNKCVVGQYDSYGNLVKDSVKGDGIEAHHMPSKQFMAKYGISERDALALNIKHSTHTQTFTYSFLGERNEWYLSLSPEEALRVDLSNLRAIFAKEGTLETMEPILKEYAEACRRKFPQLFS